MADKAPSLPARCFAEFLGTFLLVFFGCGVVHAAVLLNVASGLWQVAVVWGVAIMAAVYVVGGVSGAHINPAITVALAFWTRFSWRDVPGYVAAQLFGAFTAAATLYALFSPYLAQRERDLGIQRGTPDSVLTAMCYGEYFPNPGTWEEEYRKRRQDPAELMRPQGLGDAMTREQQAMVPHLAAFLAEVLGTAILGLAVFTLTDRRNRTGPGPFAPVFIGLTVAILIAVLAPLTQACFNPARDFGPRWFAYLAGWKAAAIPGPNGIGFATVYLLAPTLGAIVGGGCARVLYPPAASSTRFGTVPGEQVVRPPDGDKTAG